jgi:hypothetical protein
MSPRKSRRGNFLKGRLWLIALFIMLRGLDCLMFFCVPVANKRPLMGDILNSILWSTVLLAAIWCRKNWARYVMVFQILIGVVFAFILEASFADRVPGNTLLVMATFTAGQLTAALILIFSPSIQKLTNNAYI